MNLPHEQRELTDFQKSEIVEGCKVYKQADISQELNIPQWTVSNFISCYKWRKSPTNLQRHGALWKLSTSNIRYLVCTAEFDTKQSLTEISINTTFANVSTWTIHRWLKEKGIRKWKVIGCSLLTQKDAKACYKWARTHRHWTKEDWAKIVWSDECIVKQDSDPRQSWIFRRQNKCEKYDPKNIRTKLKYSGVKQMVWACFSNNKLGPITFINGTINSHLYISILEAKLVPFIQVLQGNGLTNIVFRQDNARVYTSKLATSWLTNSATQNKFSTIEWPAYSHDMNPIKELCAHLKIELHQWYSDTKSHKGLSDAIN